MDEKEGGEARKELSSDQIRGVLIEVEEYLGILLEELSQVGEQRPELATSADRQAVARVLTLADHIKKRALGVLPEAPFRSSVQVKPSPVALSFLSKARAKELKNSEDKKSKLKRMVESLTRIFSVRINVEDPAVLSKINEFCERNVSKDGLDINFVINAFSEQGSPFCIVLDRGVIEACFRHPSAEDIVSNPKVSIFRSGVLPSKYFEQFLQGRVAALVMNLQKIWQSRVVEGKKDSEFLAGLISRAKKYIDSTFNEGFLGKKLASCTSLDEIQNYARRLPVDEGSFDLLKKAHLFLKVMEIILSHDSEVNLDLFSYNSDNLRAEVDDFSLQLPNGTRYLNPPRDIDGDPISDFEVDYKGMVVDRIEVAEGKPIYSTIDKVFRKDVYDLTDCGDFARMRIFLTKDDCYDEDGTFNVEKAEKAIEKVLGIMISRFGQKVDLESLDYSLLTGKSNEASKGAHRGFHFNFKYSSSCNGNELNASGEPLTRSINVECQILAYMPKDDYDADHKQYEKSRKTILFKKLGFENGFDNFVMDLMSAVSNDKYEFEFQSSVDPFSEIEHVDEEMRAVYERHLGIGNEEFFPENVDLESLLNEGWILFSKDKFRLFVLLLAVLTKRNADGSLTNEKIIEHVQKYFPGKLERILNKLSKIIKTDEFKDGGEKAYLRRVIEAKINFVRGLVSTNRFATTGGNVSEVFRANHFFRVGNVSRNSKGNPTLSFVTHFPNVGGNEGAKMETPYKGPIGLVGILREGGHVIDFCWQFQNGKRSAPAYRIEYHDERQKFVTCHLLKGTKSLLMWKVDVNFFDEDSGLNGVLFRSNYSIENGEGNVAEIVQDGFEAEERPINVSGFLKLTPSSGMTDSQAKPIRLAEEAGKIWANAKRGGINAGEYLVRGL